MYKKFNSKKLLVLLVVLVAIVFAVVIYDAKKGDRSFRAEMIDADTARITKIMLFPKSEEGQVVELLRQKDDGWKVRSGKNLYNTDAMMINSMLGTLGEMKTLRVAGNDKSVWKEFDVTDSAAVRVKVYTGRKEKSDLYIGRFNYQQPKNKNPYDYYNQQRGTMSTYVRLADEKTVYLVEGFLAMTFNRTPNDFRNKTIIRSDKKEWTRLSFSYPADSSFNLVLENGKWMINGLMADSALVDSYFNSISWVSSQNINDEAKPLQPMYSVKIDGNNFTAPIEVKAFPADTVNKFFVSSSQNEGVYFGDRDEDVIKKIFVGKNQFFK